MGRRTLCAIAIAGCLAVPGFNAQAPAARRIFLDAVGADSQAVEDLRADEVEVTEASERRQITSLARIRRPARIVYIVDNTEYIRQQVGQVRTALLGFVDRLAPEHEMMLITVAGTMQIRVRPTVDRKSIRDGVSGLFGLGGRNQMHRHIDDAFHRFALTTVHRPIFVVVTAEGFESTTQINPQEIAHLTDEFASRGGILHAVRVTTPMSGQAEQGGGGRTDLPPSLMVARGIGGAYTFTSPAGLREVLQRLADVINAAQADAPQGYQIEYAGVVGGKRVVPSVRVSRPGVTVTAFAERP